MTDGILLEAGTNEIEVLELFLGNQSFGVNVLKVRQILKYEPNLITFLPDSHPSLKGNFLFQGVSIPLIDLNAHLQVPPKEPAGVRQIILVCEFNNAITGFLVDGVDKIHRISWDDIQPPSSATNRNGNNFTGIAIMDTRQVLMVDFESILERITGELSSDRRAERPDTPEEARKGVQRRDIKLMVVDDSRLIREQIERRLLKANYSSITQFDNGAAVYQAIVDLQKKAATEGKAITNYLIIVITDIEMPGMDGLTLCKRIKSEVPDVKVIVLSSLITTQMALKCEQVRADAYLSKNDINDLIDLVDRFCL